MPVKRVSTLTQVLKETQPGSAGPDQKPQSGIAVIAQNDTTVLPQNDSTVLPQSDILVKRQRTRKTDERDKVTYYLDPGQLDKLEDLRMAYKKATGKRLSEQDFMRMIVDRLDLQMLL